MFAPTSTTPPLSRSKLGSMLLAQTMGGALSGAALAYLGMVIGQTFFAGDPAGFGDIIAALAGIVLGYPLGLGLAVWAIGRAFGRVNRWFWVVLASYLGSWSVFLIAQLRLIQDFNLAWILFFIGGLVAALVSAHAGRQ